MFQNLRLPNFSTKLAIRVGLGVFALTVIIGALFVWRAMNGPVSLGPLTSRVEAMINAGLTGIQLRFDDSIIEWSEGSKFAHLQFIGVRVVDDNGGVLARIPKANITLSGPALMGGKAAPTSVELIGVNANVVRRKEGGFQLGLQISPDKKSSDEKAEDSQGVVKAVLQAMLKPSADDSLSKYLKRFAITNARLSIFDEETRSNWVADNATLSFDRKPDGVIVSVNAPVSLANKSKWQFTASGRYKNGSQNIALEAAFKPVNLSLLAANGSGLQSLKGFNIPVQGNVACAMSIDAVLETCKLWLNAGTGDLQLPALKREPIHFKEAALTAELDFRSMRYSISEASWKGNTIRGQISGDGEIKISSDGALQSFGADWTAENVFMDAPNLFDGAFALETVQFKGAFDAAQKSLAIEKLFARKGRFELSLSGTLQDNPVSTGVTLTGTAKELSIPDLKRLWPAGTVTGARDWIFANVHEGLINGADISVNLAPGALVDERIPNEMLNIGFKLSGLKVTYLQGLPDLTNVSGTAILNGDTFRAQMNSGNVGTISMKTGAVLIEELHKHGAVGKVTGTMDGPTRDILLLLDLPRLKYPSRYGIPAAKAAGSATVDFAFAIPMLRDLDAGDIGVDVNAELRDIKLPINDRLGLTGGKFSVKLDMKGLKALGAVQINGASVGFIWNEDFTGTAKHGTHIDVTATLTENQRNVFGLDVGSYLRGKTAIVATFTGKSGKIQNAVIDANLTASRLSIPELNWAKPEDSTASLKANIAFKPGDIVEIFNIDASGKEIKAQGSIVLSGSQMLQAEFKKLELGKRNDFALNYVKTDTGESVIDVRGKAFDAAGLFESEDSEQTPQAKGEKKPEPVTIKADLSTLHLQAGVSVSSVKFNYIDDGLHLTNFRLNAVDQNDRINGELTTTPDGARHLTIDAGNAGRVVRGVTGFRSLIGGHLKFTANLSPLTQGVKTDAAFDGKLVVDDFKITDQPFFARLLSAGSFTGLDDLMRGEGITFTKLEQTIHGRGELLTFSDGRAAGPSIGLTMQGTYKRDTEKLDLNGTIVPLYGLNSMFEDIPLVSDILGSKNGEGIFAVTYGIRGQVDDLKVAVNPISVLAPGFLRKIFQGDEPEAAAPMPLPMPKPDAKAPASPPAKTN